MELPADADAAAWLARWDQQQELYAPFRERRFRAMFDFVGAALPPRFRALDLACGPGSLSQRLLTRFPEARAIQVDFDPVLLAIGRRALAPLEARTHWVEADLRLPTWTERVPSNPVDAVLSTTALHWFLAPRLHELYREVAGRLRPGGIFLNGDHMAFRPDQATIAQWLRTVAKADEKVAVARPKAEDWELWWKRARAAPGFGDLFKERDRRFPREHGDEPTLTVDDHMGLLREAGFSEVGVIWQEHDNRVIAALRGPA